MAQLKVDILARDLVRLLNELTSLHAELTVHMRTKLEAIKKADTDRIASITAREMVLADRLQEREGLRRQMTRHVLAGLNKPANDKIKLTELAEYFAEPRRSQLLVAAAGLRARLEEMGRLQTISRLVTGEMLKHLGAVMSVMTSGGPGAETYGRSGQRERASVAHVFEAVG